MIKKLILQKPTVGSSIMWIKTLILPLDLFIKNKIWPKEKARVENGILTPKDSLWRNRNRTDQQNIKFNAKKTIAQ